MSLTALAELERRYDGPIPDQVRLAALAGGADAARQLRAARAEATVQQRLRDAISRLAAARRQAGAHLSGLDRMQKEIMALHAEARKLRCIVHAAGTNQS